LGIVGKPLGESIAKFMSTNLPNQEESKYPTKNSSNPRTPKTPKLSPFTHGFGGESKGKEPQRVHTFIQENTPKNPPREGSENHHKERTRTTQPSLEEPHQIIYTSQEGSYKV
jgi:hypothetical protein